MRCILLTASAYPHNMEMLEMLREYWSSLPEDLDPNSDAAFMLGFVIKDFLTNAKISWAVEMPLVEILNQHGWCQRSGVFQKETQIDGAWIDVASLNQQLTQLIGLVRSL